MVQHKLAKFLVAAILLLSCAAAVRAEEPKGHRMGEWPALSANILNAQQKNLNLDDRDFVIEVWFRPLDWIKYKTTAPACLVSKKGGANLAGFDVSYEQDGTVSLTVCDKANELLPDSEFYARKILKMDGWNYLAVVAGHKDKKVTFYVDGKKVKECDGFNAGDISNRDNFNITYNEYMPNSQAHCLLSQARVWKLTKELPGQMDKVIAAHQEDAAKVSDALKGAADYSMWTFEAGNDNIKDQGSNGNELVYTPWGFKGQQDTVKVPEKVAGDTYYVDGAKGDDANDGSKDKPFKTVARGARAAMPGDLLHICAGVYRESLRLREGTSDKPITAEGEPGTVVSGFDPVSGWEKGEGGQWIIKGWTGNYSGPMDAKEDDARKEPGNILFVDGTPMDFVMTKTELAPGTWTIDPILHGEGAKTITLCPLPGVDPTKVPAELSDCRKSALLSTTKFNQVRGIHFTGSGVGAGGGVQPGGELPGGLGRRKRHRLRRAGQRHTQQQGVLVRPDGLWRRGRDSQHVRGQHDLLLLLAAVQRKLARRGDQDHPDGPGFPHAQQRDLLQLGRGHLVRHQRPGLRHRGQYRSRQHGLGLVRRVLLRQHLAGQHRVQQRRAWHVRGQFQ